VVAPSLGTCGRHNQAVAPDASRSIHGMDGSPRRGVERVSDPADPRLRDFTALRDVQLRSRREAAEGLFLAEGAKTIRRALAAGYRIRTALLVERWLEPLADVLGDAEVIVVEAPVLEATTGFPVHRGALASFERRPLPPAEELLRPARRVAVLEDLADHTNLGLVFRSAAGLGMDAVLLTPRCADPLYRRAVKTSMGAVFAVPWTRIAWSDGPALLRSAGFRLLALTPSADGVALDEIEATGRLAIALGSEGDGLSSRWLDAADAHVRIPMRPGIDSLNVAAAAAIAFHALGEP
jgi:tRNA G18 (ribose-2'-O)-methylase SpoU